MKIGPMGAELLHADGWTETRDKANSRFSQCTLRNRCLMQCYRAHYIIKVLIKKGIDNHKNTNFKNLFIQLHVSAL